MRHPGSLARLTLWASLAAASVPQASAGGDFDVVTMSNGDIFNGTVAQPSFTLQTAGGRVVVPYVHMARVVLSDEESGDRLETRGGDLFVGSLLESEVTMLRVLDPTLPLDVRSINEILFAHPVGSVPGSSLGDIVQLQDGSHFSARVTDSVFSLSSDRGEENISRGDVHIIDVYAESDSDEHMAQILENGGHTHQGRLGVERLGVSTEFGNNLSFPPETLSLVALGVAGEGPREAKTLRLRVHPQDLIHDTLPDGTSAPPLLRLRGGRFIRGDIQGNGDGDERPARELRISPFAIGLYEVTFAEFDRFCRATRHQCPDDQEWGRGDRPVVNVSWKEASAYTAWLSRTTGKSYRLPSDAEWEYAARGGTTTRFWWGDEPLPGLANCEGCGSLWDGEKIAPVGRFPPNPFGLHDTAGNVFEWVADCWHDSYKEAPVDGSPLEKPGCGKRVIRGGAWSFTDHEIRSANRWRDFPARRSDDTGFRVARDLTPEELQRP